MSIFNTMLTLLSNLNTRHKYYLFLLIGISLLASCSNQFQKHKADYAFRSATGRPDYSNLDYWAAHPDKKDPSDSIPFPIRTAYKPDTAADVFFIYPTTYLDKNKALGWNAAIDDARLNFKTDYSTILFQASIFNEAGRIYSPRYRQANYYCYFPKTAEDSAKALAAFDLAYEDVKTAFLWYLQRQNHNRPIIIAAHSQGAMHAKRLLKEFFDGKELQKKLVAAYIIGWQLEPDYFDHIKPCSTPDQTGCACSWRTFKDGYKAEYVLQEKFTALVTNPLTWDAQKTEAGRESNPGGLLFNFNKLVPAVTNAKIQDGVLWTEKPHFFGNIFLTTKNYHIADMNLFYLSIRNNAKQRVAAYVKK